MGSSLTQKLSESYVGEGAGNERAVFGDTQEVVCLTVPYSLM